MQYETQARPLLTFAELQAAFAAGAAVEFTACGNDYNLPKYSNDNDDSRGWIPVQREAPGDTDVIGNSRVFRWRAFYPVSAAAPAAAGAPAMPGKPKWDDAPDWAKFLAQDASGDWHWYEAAPYWDEEVQEWYRGLLTYAAWAGKTDLHLPCEARP